MLPPVRFQRSLRRPNPVPKGFQTKSRTHHRSGSHAASNVVGDQERNISPPSLVFIRLYPHCYLHDPLRRFVLAIMTQEDTLSHGYPSLSLASSSADTDIAETAHGSQTHEPAPPSATSRQSHSNDTQQTWFLIQPPAHICTPFRKSPHSAYCHHYLPLSRALLNPSLLEITCDPSHLHPLAS
jgi:hypothetical protein